MTTGGGAPGTAGDRPAAAGEPAGPRTGPEELEPIRLPRPTFVVWLTIGVVAFAALVALAMYWVAPALSR